MKRTLKRKVIIRETDFEKLRRKAINSTLYDCASWYLISRDEIERDMIVRGLRGEQMPRGGSLRVPEDFLLYFKDNLYDTRYTNWRSGYDSDGCMIVQPRSNLPKVRLGWAVFEKDLESRL